MDSNETDETDETNGTNQTDDQIINNEEPIILPIPVTLSQLMGSLMVNRIHNINQIPTIPPPNIKTLNLMKTPSLMMKMIYLMKI